jgi:hypothetical protein
MPIPPVILGLGFLHTLIVMAKFTMNIDTAPKIYTINHSTIEIKDDKGATLAKGHVTTDASKQQVSLCFWSMSRTQVH